MENIILRVVILILLSFSGKRVQNNTGDPFQSCDPKALTEDGVYLYENSDFTGRCTRCISSINDLRGSSVGNDKVSSLYIRGDFAATLYQNANYLGNRSTFVKSDADIGNTFIGHDRASSIKIEAGHKATAPGVYLYEHSNYGGRCTRFKADASNFKELYIQPNAASSIRIVGDWRATVYAGENLSGGSTTFDASEPDLGKHAIKHDRARSIKVEPKQRLCTNGPGVYLYSGKNYTGTCSRFTHVGRDSLKRHRIGDKQASSIRLIGDYSAVLLAGNVSSTFTRSDPDLSNDLINVKNASLINVNAPAREASNVYRLQLRIKTADKSDAGTDDGIMVSLNQNNYTWLDYPRDDFMRNDKFTYELSTDGISRVADIKWISFFKPGDDAWCIEDFELWINNQARPSEKIEPVVLYRQQFPNTRWLDNRPRDETSLTIPFDDLRSSANWSTASIPGVRAYIDSTEITNRIIAAVGTAIHGTRAHWGKTYGPAVEIKGLSNPNRIHVDIDLSGEVNNLPNVVVDVDFDLLVSCTQQAGRAPVLNIKLDKLKADVTWLADFLFNVEDQIEQQVPNIERSIKLDLLQSCPVITIESNGSVRVI